MTRWINFTFHGVHHQFPDDPNRLVMVPVVSLPLAAGFYALFAASLQPHIVDAVFCGFASGYLMYDYSHWATHYWSPPKVALLRPFARFMKVQRKRHMRHHFGDPQLGYGVSVGLWDRVFETENL